MGKRFNPELAEMEANKIGLEFAHSNDVVKDMSRAYHVDFSNIKVHTDSAADHKVKAAGKDALAQGNDIFFGKGIFESSDPAAKGLVAHEFAHTMQQGTAMGGEMAVAESAPMGMAQGGILDWFRNLFGGKKKTQVTMLDDPTKEGFDGYKVQGDNKLRFMSTKSRAIYEMAQNATPEQLRSDPMLRQMILSDYQTSMTARLQQYEGKSYDDMFSKVFRGDSAGEMKTYNMLMRASLPENLVSEMSEMHSRNVSSDDMLDHAGERILNDAGMMEVLRAGMAGFGNSSHFSGENEGRRSGMLMNSVVLRGIAPELANKGFSAQQDYVMQNKGEGRLTPEEHSRLETEAKRRGIGMNDMKASVNLQKAVKEGPNMSAGGSRFRALLNRLFH